MPRSLLVGAAIATFVAAGALATSAQAASPDFCRDYARNAVRQYHEGEDHHRCEDRMRGDPRWSPDFRYHYNWCLTAHRDQAEQGNEQRADMLRDCTRDHHHDDYDHGDDRGYDHGDDHHDHY
jgi:hypothetical protein